MRDSKDEFEDVGLKAADYTTIKTNNTLLSTHPVNLENRLKLTSRSGLSPRV